MFGFFKKERQPAPSEMQQAAAIAEAPNFQSMDIWRRHHTAPDRISDTLLRARLAETVTWCDSLPSLEDFRSDELRPRLFHDGPDDLVCEVGGNRQIQLHRMKLPIPQQPHVAVAGRFMVYFPDENLADGYSEMVSNGFFDVDNLPAYDTWVSFFVDESAPVERSSRRHLLCYVPAALVDAANAGIDGNAEGCILWLEQSPVRIRHRVQRMIHSNSP